MRLWIGVLCIVGQGAVLVAMVWLGYLVKGWTRSNMAAMKSNLLAHESNLGAKQELRMLRVDVNLARVLDAERHIANFCSTEDTEKAG